MISTDALHTIHSGVDLHMKPWSMEVMKVVSFSHL